MTTATAKLRILCLHGYRQNDTLFREKTGSLRKQFKKYADFDFVCAPLIPNIDGNDDRADPRGWWFSKPSDQFSSRDVTDIATGFEVSVQSVVDFISRNGPFDGILGFSQGASMAHLLLALEQLADIKLNVRFVIFCSGFLSLSSMHSHLTSLKFHIPSLHVYGSGDDVVLLSTSQKLQCCFENPTSIVHEGGHFIPSMTKFKDIFSEFLEGQLSFNIRS